MRDRQTEREEDHNTILITIYSTQLHATTHLQRHMGQVVGIFSFQI